MTNSEKIKMDTKFDKMYGRHNNAETALHIMLEENMAFLIFWKRFFETQLGREFPETEDLVKYIKQVKEDKFDYEVSKLGIAILLEKVAKGDKEASEVVRDMMEEVT